MILPWELVHWYYSTAPFARRQYPVALEETVGGTPGKYRGNDIYRPDDSEKRAGTSPGPDAPWLRGTRF